MALQSSGAISMSDVNVELGKSSTTQINLGNTDVRDLFSVASGAISLASDGYGASAAVPEGQAVYYVANYGNYNYTWYAWFVPTGVTSVSVVCVGAGGGGGRASGGNVGPQGGAGGGLSYENNISVTPGERMTIRVGWGGRSGNSTSTTGGTGGEGGDGGERSGDEAENGQDGSTSKGGDGGQGSAGGPEDQQKEGNGGTGGFNGYAIIRDDANISVITGTISGDNVTGEVAI